MKRIIRNVYPGNDFKKNETETSTVKKIGTNKYVNLIIPACFLFSIFILLSLFSTVHFFNKQVQLSARLTGNRCVFFSSPD